MDFFDRRLYRLNKRLLFVVGLWPLQTRNERNFYRTTTVILFGSLLVPKLIKFFECLGDPNGMIECLPLLGVHLRSVAKLINNSVKVTKMRKLTNRIKDDWTVRINEFDEAILRTYAERGRLLTIIYVVYMYVTLMIFLSIPMIPIILDIVSPLNQSRERIVLYQTEYFVDQEEKYLYLLVHAIVVTPFAVCIFIANDTMYAVYVHHVCSIFAVLGARLQSIGGITENNKVKIYKSHGKRTDETYNNIVICIKLHNEAMEVANLIESSSCICLLFVVGSSMLTLTITGFMTVTNLSEPGEAFRFGFVAVGELIHLFYICWQGQMLMEHSEDIFLNAYNMDWCDISNRSKKLLLMIMLRSFEPCTLTAGKVFILSMENFAASLKTSMSYFTVLLSMQ